MRTAAIIISMVVAVAVAAYASVGLGILIALACGVFQAILSYSRSRSRGTVQGGLALDLTRSGVFLIPLIGALLQSLWVVAGATVAVYLVNMFLWSPGGKA